MKKRLSAAIVGVGAISELIHIPILSSFESVKIEVLVDPFTSTEKLLQLSQMLDCKWSRDYDNLDVDFAVIAVPISMHFKVAADLLKRGIDLLIEKPLVSKLEEANQLQSLCKENARRVFCGQVRRFYENVGIVKNVLSSGILGELQRISIYEGNLYGWKRSFFNKERNKDTAIDEGVLFDVGSHSIDTVLYILQNEDPKITMQDCRVDNLRLQTNIEAKGSIIFGNNNRQSSFTTSFSNSVALANCIWFSGTSGTIMLSPNPSMMPRYFPRKGGSAIILDKVNHNPTPPFVYQYNEVIEGLLTQKETRIDARHVSATVEVLENIWNSLTVGECSWLAEN